jgi:hypothetical protein
LQPAPRKTAPLAEKLLNLRPFRPFIARRIAARLRQKVPPQHYPAPYAILDLWQRYGALFATGFAPFRGGPLQYAKTRGVSRVRERLREFEKSAGERFRLDAGWDELNL